jgi:hypothetical protein
MRHQHGTTAVPYTATTCQQCQMATVRATFQKCGSFKNLDVCGKLVAVKVAVTWSQTPT